MDAGREFFARVRPLLGKGLEGKHVMVDHPELALPLLEMLHACMLDNITTLDDRSASPWPHLARESWRNHLRAKNPWGRLGASATTPDARIFVTTDDAAEMRVCAARHEMHLTVPAQDAFTAMDLFTHAAWTLKDLLTGAAPWRDLLMHLGDPRWPFSTSSRAPAAATFSQRNLHIMVIGCGSLGSEAVRLLQPVASRWTLVDDGTVTVFNPNRQWFEAGDIGERKVEALARRLAAPVRLHAQALEEGAALEALVERDRPDVVLLATGTHHHGALAEVLWRQSIPHVAVCCYPQARFFEVVIVDRARGTPCFECLRGHLYRGAAAPPPMPDEIASFVYSAPNDSERHARFADLVAEPAFRMDTFRAACVAARAVTALTLTVSPLWLARALAEGTTCLLGANRPVRKDDNTWAYGLEQRGQVLRLGLPDLAGAVAHDTCACCERDLRMSFVDAPAPEVDLDEAMLAAVVA